MRVSTLAIGILLVCAGPSFAQNNPQSNPQNKSAPAPQQTQSSQNIQQQVKTNLQSAGFTDIKIMPESFLVRAKDKSGNLVMMVINPDSITAVTEEVNHQNGSTTTGSAAGQGANNNGAKNNNDKK
jgi:hypothetical protein